MTPTDIYTLSLHDALPIYLAFTTGASLTAKATQHNYPAPIAILSCVFEGTQVPFDLGLRIESKYFGRLLDRKSTRLNSSHSQTSYAVFCLKKKTFTRTLHS